MRAKQTRQPTNSYSSIKTPSSKIPEQKIPPVIDNSPQQPNVIPTSTSEQIEKDMLKGEEHIEVGEHKPEVVPTEEKKLIIIKPRETYLQDKISKMNCGDKLMTSIKRGLSAKMDLIREDIKSEGILITEVPKNLEKLIPKFKENASPDADYDLKQKYRNIKQLRLEQNFLKQQIIKIEQNVQLIKETPIVNVRKKTSSDLDIEKNKINMFEIQKNKIQSRINTIEEQIRDILKSNEDIPQSRQRIKTFLDNFERDKEIIETRAKKFFKESKQRNQRIANDVTNLLNKRKKEIDEQEKNAKIQKEEFIKKFKEEENAIEQKQSQLNKEKVLKVKPYIFQKPENKAKDCLFSARYKIFQEQQENIKKLEKLKRKQLYKSIPNEEIKEFADKFDENKAKHNNESENNKQKLFLEWKSRKESLPAYQINLYDSVDEKDLKEQEEMKKEKIETLMRLKKNYSTRIQDEKQPIINQKLKQQRLDLIKHLENPKLNIRKYTLFNHKKNRIILKKRVNSKPSKYKWVLKLDEDSDNFDNSEQNLIKKPKKKKLSPITYKIHPIPDKKIDYLREMVMIKDEKKNSSNNLFTAPDNKAKWSKIMNDKSGSFVENINKVKEKAEIIEKEADMQEQVLKLNGGIENNPHLGKKLSSLLIDSIEAKLSILNSINAKLNS